MPQNVEWRPVDGFPDYEVSNDGRVRRARPFQRLQVGYQLKPAKDSFGYQCVTLTAINTDAGVKIRKTFKVHRLVALAFVGPAPSDNHVVAHDDGDQNNNADWNLKWKTVGENNLDIIRHGRKPERRGQSSAVSILTDDIVRQLRREKLATGITYNELAAKYGFDRSTIARAVSGKQNWKHITDPPPLSLIRPPYFSPRRSESQRLAWERRKSGKER